MHLLWSVSRFHAQDLLWGFVNDGLLIVDVPPESEWRRMYELMKQYSDRPMDLADATLVAVAERLGIRRIFSLDRDFHIYRIHGKESFDVIG